MTPNRSAANASRAPRWIPGRMTVGSRWPCSSGSRGSASPRSGSAPSRPARERSDLVLTSRPAETSVVWHISSWVTCSAMSTHPCLRRCRSPGDGHSKRLCSSATRADGTQSTAGHWAWRSPRSCSSMAQQRTVLIAIDDDQWIDAPSAESAGVRDPAACRISRSGCCSRAARTASRRCDSRAWSIALASNVSRSVH